MSYTESIVKYGEKDALPSGDSEKRIYGTELQAEFDAIGATFEEMRDEDGFLPGTTPGDGLQGDSEGQLTYWDGAEWATTSLIKVNPSQPEDSESPFGVVSMTCSTIIGDSNDDQHFIVGDTYIGYTKDGDKPNNSDEFGGTLFLNRGVIVGRGNEGNASIGMEGNIIWNLGDPTDDTCAVSKGYVVRELVGDVADLEDDVDTNTVNIVNMYNEQIKQALQIQALQNQVNGVTSTLLAAVERAEDFSQLKSEIINSLTSLMEMQR